MTSGAAICEPGVAGAAEAAGAVEACGFDAAGFRAFYDRTARPLWAYLSRASGSPELADDWVQEAYYRFLRSGLVPESPGHAKNYLYRIATNLMHDHFRRHRRQRAAGEVETAGEGELGPTGEPGSGSSATASAPVSDLVSDPARGARLRRDVGRFLGRLSPRDRQLLWLAHVVGASHREIAELLEVQEASVRILVFRARRRLAAMLDEHGVGPEVLA